jgi:BirA family biotin operon repressor/biotin-[acetyl-CoA-carboxylase] ligase
MNNREQILTTIRDAGDWITSATLCQRLNISRMAVSKQVSTLREMGYRINTAPRRGYHFESAPDRLYPEELHHHLNTRFIGHNIHYYKRIGSTNTQAKEAALAQCPEGTVFIAETQTQGRGRRGRIWHTGPHDACALSIVLRPRFSPRNLTLLPLLTAVAAARAIETVTGLQPQVKWPNDLLIQRKKICGILTEAGFDLETIDYVVIGIGLNINTPAHRFPPEIRSLATSLAEQANQRFNRAAIIQQLLVSLEEEYLHASENGFDDILQKWNARNCTLGKNVTIRQETGDISGTALHLTPEGGLCIKQPNGQRLTVMSGDLELPN